MADTSAQDKTLPASQRKLDKARADGQIARSRDLGHFAAIGAGSALLVAVAPVIAAGLKDALAASLQFDRRQVLSEGAMTGRLAEAAGTWAMAAVPFGLAMMLVVVAASVAMGGWTWTAKPLGPKFSTLDPLAGIGRVFSKAQLIDAHEGQPAGAAAGDHRRDLAVAPRRGLLRRAGDVAAGGASRGHAARWRAASPWSCSRWRCSPRSTCRCRSSCTPSG